MGGFSPPIGTTATILTADGYLLYGRRNNKVVFHADYLHTLGGALEPGNTGAPGQLDGFGSIQCELHEELHLEPADCAAIVCVGMIRDRQIWQPELLFEVTSRLSQAEILGRLDLTNDEEHCPIEACVAQPGALAGFLPACGLVAPVAVGSMLLHGWHHWGSSWAIRAARRMTQRPDKTSKLQQR